MAYYRDPKAKGEAIHPLYCDHCAVVDGRLAFTVDKHGDYWPVHPWRWSPFDSDRM